ncbi:MAG TPA: hypothetical protein VIJ75_19785 [Hanamia sp.]
MINKGRDRDNSIIGSYGQWANSLLEGRLPGLSFRSDEWSNLNKWKVSARKTIFERLAIRDLGGIPIVNTLKKYIYDDLEIEELSWQLPYGPKTNAILLKPVGVKGPLPAILAFYDHGLQKYFGVEKITRTPGSTNSIIKAHQKELYGNQAWANEIAKRGYVVLVADVFPFGSRRVLLENVPEAIKNLSLGLNLKNPGSISYIKSYNIWAAVHEHVIAKSLFSAGITWPAVFFGEDRIALDILCAREDVDANRIGCGGLSGGGIRTNFMGGLDPRIKCAVSVAFQTTWKDLILNNSYTHSWMTFAPLLSNDLEYPEILGLRTPLPTLVLNNSDDPLFTLSEQKRADKILKDVYIKAGAGNNYKCSFYPGPHKFDVKMQAEAFSWFDKWLKA